MYINAWSPRGEAGGNQVHTVWHQNSLWKNAPLLETTRDRARHLEPRLLSFLRHLLSIPAVCDSLDILEETVLVLLGFLVHTAAGTFLRGAFLARGLQMGGDVMTHEEHVWCQMMGQALPLDGGPEELMDLIEAYLEAKEAVAIGGTARPKHYLPFFVISQGGWNILAPFSLSICPPPTEVAQCLQ